MSEDKQNHIDKLPSAEESADKLRNILVPVALELAETTIDGLIALVFHEPGTLGRKMAKSLGLEAPRGETTVYGVPPTEVARTLGHDPVTLRWASTGPQENEIKVFLVAGDGTALLSLQIGNGEVGITAEPNIYVLPQPDETPN